MLILPIGREGLGAPVNQAHLLGVAVLPSSDLHELFAEEEPAHLADHLFSAVRPPPIHGEREDAGIPARDVRSIALDAREVAPRFPPGRAGNADGDYEDGECGRGHEHVHRIVLEPLLEPSQWFLLALIGLYFVPILYHYFKQEVKCSTFSPAKVLPSET